MVRALLIIFGAFMTACATPEEGGPKDCEKPDSIDEVDELPEADEVDEVDEFGDSTTASSEPSAGDFAYSWNACDDRLCSYHEGDCDPDDYLGDFGCDPDKGLICGHDNAADLGVVPDKPSWEVCVCPRGTVWDGDRCSAFSWEVDIGAEVCEAAHGTWVTDEGGIGGSCDSGAPTACEEAHGTWDDESAQCESGVPDACSGVGGTWEEDARACVLPMNCYLSGYCSFFELLPSAGATNSFEECELDVDESQRWALGWERAEVWMGRDTIMMYQLCE